MKFVSKTRRLGRVVTVKHSRRLTRAHFRPLAGFERAPHPLTQMLAGYRRAIRAYRRLAKLAPHHYDPAVVDRDAREREEQRRWIASWEPDLDKVYGPPTPEEREAQRQADLLAEQPPPLHPNTQRAVARALADYEFWKAAGELSRARYQEFQHRHPHYVPRLGQVVSMLEIAFDFGWIATGRDWRRRDGDQETSPLIEQDFEADLRRAYGSLDSAAPETGAASHPPLRLDRGDCLLRAGETSAAWGAAEGIRASEGPAGRASGRERVTVAAGRMRCGAPTDLLAPMGEVSNTASGGSPPPAKPERSNLGSKDDSPACTLKSEDSPPLDAPPSPFEPRSPTPVAPPPENSPAPPAVRRDAWATWARYQRRAFRK